MSDPSLEIAKEFVKQLPVNDLYKDALKKPVAEIGSIASDLLKVVHLALAPVQLLAATQDRFRHFIDRSVRRVPPPRQIAPAPQILGPVLEGIRYEPENTPIDEMFSQLLSRAMDRDRVDEAHPSFPLIIKQLSADEALILSHLTARTYQYIYTSKLNPETNRFTRDTVEVDEFPKQELRFPGNLSFYMNHLSNLGLAGIYDYKNQEPIWDEGKRVQTGTKVFCRYSLTDIGCRFMKACTETIANS
jgi:hypothetical protein